MKLRINILSIIPLLVTLTACTFQHPKEVMIQHSPRFGRGVLEESIAKYDIQYIKVGDTHRLVFPADKFFKTNTAKIKRSRYGVMNDVTVLLRSYGKHKIQINGYSDNVRSDENSEAFSLHRAQSFLAYFWAHGMDVKQMEAKGHGENNAVATNRTTVGSVHNRRIEVSWDTMS